MKNLTRIVFTAVLLAVLGGCAAMGQPGAGSAQSESPYPVD